MWLLVNKTLKQHTVLILLKAAVSIYDAGHTAKTPHHCFFYLNVLCFC